MVVKKIMLVSAAVFCGSTVARDGEWRPYVLGAAIGAAVTGIPLFIAMGRVYFQQKNRADALNRELEKTRERHKQKLSEKNAHIAMWKGLANGVRWVEWKDPSKLNKATEEALITLARERAEQRRCADRMVSQFQRIAVAAIDLQRENQWLNREVNAYRDAARNRVPLVIRSGGVFVPHQLPR